MNTRPDNPDNGRCAYRLTPRASWYSRGWLLLVHALIASWGASALDGVIGAGWLLAGTLSVGYALWRAGRPISEIVLAPSGDLHFAGGAYRLGGGSRILPGCLHLQLRPQQPGPSCKLWLFADSLPPGDYRRLAREITLSRPDQ